MIGRGFHQLRNKTLKTPKKQVFLHFETEIDENARKVKQHLKDILLVLQWCIRNILAV